ncbi:MAG: hypothetical protein COW71_13560 [Ignavibacteriales bacterium CG18_big_fil_WC_8_21_14_2_50_31_20]|nr:MAG: hypothetical protein COW71_13560 [Ignavibacteriales bacterium CG18_big_fil_WC_8_21_14_2_50_31_20]
MPLYLNELAPWERKNEYYHTIQLGKDVNEQTLVIKKQAKAMLASQLATTNSIIASKERISEGIDSLVDSVDRLERVGQSIDDLQSTFEWGISEVVWQLEQNRTVLKNILEVLMSPLDNQARERRIRAKEAYDNGWLDDAEEEYLESEKLNKFDFSIHISLGIIYLFKKIDKEKALSYFEKAIKYAKPKSPDMTRDALLYKALIKFDFGEIEEAEKFSSDAITLSPNSLKAYYQNAQYNAQLKNHIKSIDNLEKIIKQDKLYCLKAHEDTLFDPIREYVNNLFKKLKEEEKTKAIKTYDNIIIKNKKMDLFFEKYSTKINISRVVNNSQQINRDIIELKKRLDRNSLFDFIEINNIYLPALINKCANLYQSVENEIKEIIYNAKLAIGNTEYKRKKAENEHLSNIEEYLGKTGGFILIASFIVPAVTTLLVTDGWEKLSTILFCIPIISQISSLVLLEQFIFNFSGLSKDSDGIVIAWSIVIYLITAIILFVISKSISKAKMNRTIIKTNIDLGDAKKIINNANSILNEFENLLKQ